MPLRGLLYRRLMEKKKRTDKGTAKEKKETLVEKKPVKIEKTSRLHRFFKRPAQKIQNEITHGSAERRSAPKEPRNEFRNIKTSRMTPHRLIVKPAEQGAALIKGRARYWGGHFLYPIDDAEKGVLTVQNGTLTFLKSGMLNKSWSINIPLKKINWKSVSQVVKESIYPVTCFSVPFKDEKGISQNPLFSVDESPARENFSHFLYEKMTRKK